MGESKDTLFDFPVTRGSSDNRQRVVVLNTAPATDDGQLHVVVALAGEEVETMMFFFIFA